MKFRIYQDIGNGLAVETDFVRATSGETLPVPAKTKAPVRVEKVLQNNCPVLPAQNQTNITSMNSNLPYGVLQAEGVMGNRENARVEVAGWDETRSTFRIGISNGEATTETFVLGAGYGIAQLSTANGGLGVVAPKAGVVISGSFGTATYTQLATLSLGALRMHGLHMIGKTTAGAASTAFFDSGNLKFLESYPNGDSVQLKDYNLSDLVTPETYQTNIRQDKDFRAIVDGYNGLFLTIPAGEAVFITFMKLASRATGHVMVKM